MRNIIVLGKRELMSYFYSPLAYVIMTAFLLCTGFFFYNILREAKDADTLRYILGFVSFISMIISPMITMRLLAEEKKAGTLEMLMTAPITETEVVLAKYLSALVFFITLTVPTFAYAVLLFKWGNPDGGAIISGYVGLFCLTGVFLSIGLFVSSFTSNQVIAVIIAFVILIILWVFGWWAQFMPAPWKDILGYIGFNVHLESFGKGLLDSRDIVYCLSMIVFFIFMSVRVLESRRWK